MKYMLLMFLFTLCAYSSPAQKDSIRLYFNRGETQLPDNNAALLDSLFDNYRINSTSRIEIIGYADEPGTRKQNNEIAQRRAVSVKQFLEVLGVKKIESCKGAGNAIASGDDPLQRRVDIIIDRTPAAQKPAATPMPKTGSVPVQKSRIEAIANMDVNSTLVLYGLNFTPASTKLLPQAYPVMNELLKVLKEHPGLKISVEGHVCCGIDPAASGILHNQLSFARAQAVYNYLKSHGVDSVRLSYEGFGFSRPKIFPECDEQDRITNRRVEVRVLSK